MLPTLATCIVDVLAEGTVFLIFVELVISCAKRAHILHVGAVVRQVKLGQVLVYGHVIVEIVVVFVYAHCHAVRCSSSVLCVFMLCLQYFFFKT